MNQILENSLYSTPTELADLLKDKEKVASAFFINFLGTLGLFAISSTRGIMKNYYADDGKLQITNIGDANKDASLAAKLYHDIGGLKPDTANKVTRLLFKLKSRAITSKTFDEAVVRELIKEIQYLSHRPHPVIMNVVKQFESGTANIKQVAKAFFLLVKARKKDFGSISKEFYEIARQYQIYLKDVADIGSAPSAAITIAASTQTSVPHATSGTASATPVSNVVDQRAKADKIQLVAKPAAVTDEDFYLLLWKATSGREVSKLLKERGYDSFTPELMKKAVDYLLPATSDQESHFNMIMSSMPDIETFNKAFGYFMKNDAYHEFKWRMVLLYKSSLGKSASEVKQNLALARLPIRKMFSVYSSGMINGKSKDMLRRMCFDTVINEFQRKIVTTTATDDTDAMFEILSKELNLMSDAFKESSWRGDFSVFPNGSTLSEKEKIKYLIAFSNKSRNGYTKGIYALTTLMKAQGIAYSEDASGYNKTIIIQQYENLFPGAKECIDAWYKNVDHNFLRFGSFDAYGEIVKKWSNGYLNEAISQNIRHIPESEEPTTIADKIVALIDKVATGPKDQQKLFENIACSVSFGSADWQGSIDRAAKVSGLIQITYAKRFKGLIERGEFKLDLENSTQSKHVEDMFDMIRSNFNKKSSRTGDEQWKAYVEMKKAIFAVEPRMQNALLIKSLSYGASIESVLPFANADWGVVVKTILADRELYSRSYPEELLERFQTAQYMKEEDYQNLARSVNLEVFIKICAGHKVDPYKYLPYEEIKAYITKMLTDRYRILTDSTVLKQAFDRLKQEDKDNFLNNLKSGIFGKTSYSTQLGVDTSSLRRLDYLIGKDAINEYLNSSSNEEKIALMIRSPDWFFNRMTIDNLNKTLVEFFNDPRLLVSMSKTDFIYRALKRKDEITIENAKSIVNWMSQYNRGLKPSARREYEQMYYSSIEILSKKSKAAADDIFMQMPLNERRSLVGYVVDERYMAEALNDVQGDNVLIKPLIPVTEERLVQILKYNDIQTPRRPIVKEGDKLSDVLSKTIAVPPIKDLHVDAEDLSDEELEKLAVEYDAFNRYAHGDIALKIKRSFNVSVPMQEEGFKRWMDKMSQEGLDPRVMKPIFHGTGSIGAAMILRYGFKVIKSNDPSVVGRMLGDGIYFSNVLDKVAQYVGDEGFSRRYGTQGFIFEMEGSLGKPRRDYRCAGTGAKEDERGTVSPEWAVFEPNEQLRIYKAYHVELISKNAMNVMKQKHLGTNESTAVEIKSFKSFLNEGVGDMPHCITDICMDGDIPVSDKSAIDFKDFNSKKFGKHVNLDWTGSGPSVMIYNRKESKTFVVRYTREFMEDREGELTDYLKLLSGKK